MSEWADGIKSRIDRKIELTTQFDRAIDTVVQELRESGINTSLDRDFHMEPPRWTVTIHGNAYTLNLNTLSTWKTSAGTNDLESVIRTWVEETIETYD